MQSYILGMDIGTGSTKAVALTPAGQVLGVEQVHYPIHHPKPGYSEQDPEAIWQAAASCIRRMVKRMGRPPEAAALSSAMHSLIPADEEGQALHPMITWADGRSAGIAEALQESESGQAIYLATGTPLHPMSPLCKIRWLKENAPDLFARTCCFLSIKDYIWFHLFGVFEADHSLASASGLMDIHQRVWHPAALSFCGISERQLPVLRPTGFLRRGLLPEAATLLCLPRDIPFCIGGSDGCLANLGSHALAEGTAALTIGTSGAVRIASKKPVLNTSAMPFSYLLDEQCYICGGPVNNGGNIVDWLLQQFGSTASDHDALFAQIASIPTGSRGLLFLPYLHGERAPVWDARSSGSFIGIRAEHRQGHFLRAALEGVCYGLNSIIRLLQQEGASIETIHASGGFVRSKVWLQLLADISGRKIIAYGTEDASAIGAALLAYKVISGATDYPEVEEAPLLTVQPNADRNRHYQPLIALYESLYPLLKEPMHRLYELNRK